MIFRTPPPKRPRDDAKAIESSPVGSDRRLVIYEDPVVQLPESSHEPQPSDHMLCTYQCRQMVAGDALGCSLNSGSDGLLRVRSYFLELSENQFEPSTQVPIPIQAHQRPRMVDFDAEPALARPSGNKQPKSFMMLFTLPLPAKLPVCVGFWHTKEDELFKDTNQRHQLNI
ncbi:hypothetical protein GH714_026886 [Hevea brasiliensis]|uniref:Uncharacterized protein n=1 Tax=Hevea brasiliensis TaxID=3981 RepID=A0A6A6N627_HEVBR|nr:hypothetical protein GH714_026886 [Hevea brasiliensis]